MSTHPKVRRQIVRPAAPGAVHATIAAGKTAIKAYLAGSGPQTCRQIARGLNVAEGAKFAQNTRLSHFLTLAVRHGDIHAVARPQAKRTKLYSLVAPDGQQFLPFEQEPREPRTRLQVLGPVGRCASCRQDGPVQAGVGSTGALCGACGREVHDPCPKCGVERSCWDCLAQAAPLHESQAPTPAVDASRGDPPPAPAGSTPGGEVDDDLERRAAEVGQLADEVRAARANLACAQGEVAAARQRLYEIEQSAAGAERLLAEKRARLRQAMQGGTDTG